VLPLVPFACMPSLIPRQVWWNLFARTVPPASAFPRVSAGRRLHCTFRGLLSVHSPYGLHARQVTKVTLYTGGSDGFVISTAASDCYRVERTSSLAGVSPAVDQRLSRRTTL